MLDVLAQANWVDLVVVILFVRIIYVGSNLGVGSQLIYLITQFLFFFGSLYLYGLVSIFIYKTAAISFPISDFLALGLIVVVLLYITKLVQRVFQPVQPQNIIRLEKIAGFFIGGARAMLISGIVLLMIMLIPFKGFDSWVMNSSFAYRVVVGDCVFYVNVVNKIPFLRGENGYQVSDVLAPFLVEKPYDFSLSKDRFKNVRKYLTGTDY